MTQSKEKTQNKTTEEKIADLLNEERPRPDILECIDILRHLEGSFLGHLKENINDTKSE